MESEDAIWLSGVPDLTVSKRTAVIIGINNYQSKTLPPLQGAENDATEVYERLIAVNNIENSPFRYEIPKESQLLLGEQATFRNITRAISNVFRKPDAYDMVIFYFSGHGVVGPDEDEGYISTYDMETDPYVCGINMKDLKQILFKSENKAKILLMLDCCHSGMAIGGTQKTDENKMRNEMENRMKGMITGPAGSPTGTEMLLMASSEGTKTSREKPLSHKVITDPSGQEHTHGIFTYALLEGLDGEAADKDGTISCYDLGERIRAKMTELRANPPIFHGTWFSLEFPISLATKKYLDNIGRLKEKLVEDINAAQEISNVVDAAKILRRLSGISNTKDNEELENARNDVIAKADIHYQTIRSWGDSNRRFLFNPCNQVSATFWSEIDALIDSVSDLQKLQDLSDTKQSILSIIADQAWQRPSEFASANDDDRKVLIRRFLGRIQNQLSENSSNSVFRDMLQRRQFSNPSIGDQP